MTPQETKDAIACAEAAVANALRSGEKPDPSDLLLLQHLTPPRTFCERIRASAFPLIVVTIAMLIMALLATSRPPVVEIAGEARTTALDLTFNADLPDSKALILASRSALQFRASGFSRALIGACTLDLLEESLLFTGTRIHLPLGGATHLRLEADRLEASFGGANPSLSLFVTSETNSVVDAFGVTIDNPQRLEAECHGQNDVELDPGETEPVQIEIAVPRVAAADFPDFLTPLLKLPVSAVTFGHLRTASHTEFCALQSAQMLVRQEIKVLGISAEETVTPPAGTCFEITGGDVTVTPLSDGVFKVRFASTASNVDDGLPANATTSTYLEILTSAPHISLILGAITFILTTVWSIAVLLKEILKP